MAAIILSTGRTAPTASVRVEGGSRRSSPNQENDMHRLISRLGVIALAAFVLLAGARADDKDKGKDKDKPKAEKVPLDKIPKKVMDAIKARFPKADITSVEKETEDGKVVYDIELKSEGRKYEMDIQEDGTVIEIEKEVLAKDVPEAITKAVLAKYPKAKIQVVMEVNKVKGKDETPIHYEVTLETADKKTVEVAVSLDGKSVKAEGEK
jgi:uncharacterized membrane protein YkoI